MITLSSGVISKPVASFVGSTLLSANVADPVILPASNVRGVLVFSGSMLSINSSAIANISLVGKASTPANFADGLVLRWLQEYVQNGSLYCSRFAFEVPLLLPAGLGLYFVSNVAETGGARSVNYKIL